MGDDYEKKLLTFSKKHLHYDSGRDILFLVAVNKTLLTLLCGSGSAVEHRLAKARVAGSIPVFRSIIFAPLAQLDRAFDYESKGREFESLRARHFHLVA